MTPVRVWVDPDGWIYADEPKTRTVVEHVAIPAAEWEAREAYVKELERAIVLARACGEVVSCRAFDAVIGEAKE